MDTVIVTGECEGEEAIVSQPREREREKRKPPEDDELLEENPGENQVK